MTAVVAIITAHFLNVIDYIQFGIFDHITDKITYSIKIRKCLVFLELTFGSQPANEGYRVTKSLLQAIYLFRYVL